MIKKIITLIITISYIATCNGPCYGLGARTLFQHRSHAQRNLENIDSYNDIISTPSFISIPQNLGRIVEYYKGKSSALIVLIQDRHTDPITQNNVASIIETLNQQYNIHLMCLEGASEELDTSFYDSFKDTPLKRKVARFFVEKALFTGAEFYKITNRTNYLKAVGVEDKGVYLEHLANYKNNQISKSTALNLLRSLSVAADNLQDRVYSKGLKGLDNISRAYLSGGLSFSEYISRLKAHVEKSDIDIKVYPNLEKFINLAEKEKTIDFDGASKEREAVAKYFIENLKKEEARELIQMSTDFRLKNLSEIVFYDYLESLIIDHQLQTADYKNLFAYIDYLRFSKTINHLEVFNEAEDLEENAQLALCDNPVQKQLVEYSKAIRMLRDLYNLKLTRRHLDYMEENSDFFDIIKIQRFLKNISGKHGLRIASATFFTGLDRKAIEESKKFYALALERDIALTENTLKSMKQYHGDKSVLIAGGFHTQGITNILKEKGISYVVICPTIGPDDCEKLYNDRMQGLLPDIAALRESFAHMLPVPLYTGGAANKASSSGVQERFAALLDTSPRADLNIEEKQITKASSVGRKTTPVYVNESIILKKDSETTLLAGLGVCFAVAVMNKDGERFMTHLYPTKQWDNSDVKADTWKDAYVRKLLSKLESPDAKLQNELKNKDPQDLKWRAVIIPSGAELDGYPEDYRIMLEDIKKGLKDLGIEFIVDDVKAHKSVKFYKDGLISIVLLDGQASSYDIDILTKPASGQPKASSSGTLSEDEKQKAESICKHMRDIHIDNVNSRTGYASYLTVEYSKDNVYYRETNAANPYFYPVHFAKEFSKLVDNSMDLNKQKRLFDYVLKKMQQDRWADIFWQVYADYKTNTNLDWFLRDVEPKVLEEKLSKILPIKPSDVMQGNSEETATGIVEYILNKEKKDTLREAKKEISDFRRACIVRNSWLIRDINIYKSVDSFQKAIQELHATAAKSLNDTRIVSGLSQPRMIEVQNSERPLYFPNSQQLDLLMQQLAYRVIHDVSFKSRHVILQAAEIFLRIMDMQYFADGNRRVARLMANYHLMLNNYPQIFVDNEDEYINILRFMRVPEELADFVADGYLSRQENGKWDMDESSGTFILRPFDLRPKTSSSGTKILSEELRIDTNEALNHYIAPLYDPSSYLGLGRVTFITNARSFTEVDKKHLRKLAAQNIGLSDDDLRKITIVTVYDQAKAVLKDCGFTDMGKRPSVLGITDFGYLADGRWQEIAQGEQIAMIAANIRGQNRAVITITNDKVAEGIASTILQYLNDRKKGKIVIASMQGATERTKIGNDIIEEDEIMFSAVLAHAVKETRTQLRQRGDQQLFILEALPPIDSMAFEKFIKSLMDTKAAIDAAASAA